MRKKYSIAIDCANCANKIERRIAKLPEIKAVSINFVTQKMMVEYMDDVDTISAEQQIRKIGQKVDSDFAMY